MMVAIGAPPVEWTTLVDDTHKTMQIAITASWPSARDRCPVFAEDHETTITKYLVLELRRWLRHQRSYFPILVSEEPLLYETEEGTGKVDDRRPDISLKFGQDAKYDLHYECKRLYFRAPKTGKITSGVSKYISQGVLRFVSGAYCPVHAVGAMIGYVQHAQTHVAKSAVAAAIKKKATLLALADESWIADPGNTRHKRSNGDFSLSHIFLCA